MRSAEALATLQELGSSQRGLVTTSQAERYGVSRVALGRLRDRGLIHQARRGVYMLPSGGDESLQDLHAAWLGTEPTELAEQRLEQPDVAVSHISAAHVHGLGDLVGSVHEFTSTRRRRSSQPDVRIHRGDLPDGDVTVVDGLPVTSIPRTVADLADADVDFDHLAYVVRDALSSPAVRPRDLARRLDTAAKNSGMADGDAFVDACLEHAGLPAVAQNLTSSRESLMRLLGSEVWQDLMRRTAGNLTGAHWKSIGTDRATALWGATGPPTVGAAQALSSAYSTALWGLAKPPALWAFRNPALEALHRSATGDLVRSMHVASPLRATPATRRDADEPTDGDEERDADGEAQAADTSSFEDVAEGEAEREGS